MAELNYSVKSEITDIVSTSLDDFVKKAKAIESENGEIICIGAFVTTAICDP